MSVAGDSDVPTMANPPAKKKRFGGLSSMLMIEIVAVAGGLLGTIVYAFGSNGTWSTFSASVMIAGAALASGGLIGILFGVPRSIAAGQQTDGNPPTVPLIGANTNLEQISDWLTKIIVGVTLTQFNAIRREGGRLFHSLAPAVGGGDGAAAFAGSIVVYFVVVGFLIGWLYARLRLSLAMSGADAMLELSRRADRAGDTKTADAARETARSLTQITTDEVKTSIPGDIPGLMSRYEELRATQPSGPRRTASMEDLVRQGRQQAATEKFTALDVRGMFERGTEGGRIMALALMEGDLALADLSSVLTGITAPASPFEQFHALTVANLMVSSLTPADRDQLAAPLQNPDIANTWAADTSRSSLAKTILDRLQTLRTNA